ncbi:tRNA (5-methylaminomethyl-2-thiouridylate)-methyltransferase [Treponema primitia ZAS-2]|uniref:tRNA-specific 2-thiouridylase MnmA n=1 Tax=Treponema primitia (strain ATCC BAA-887 / DSM 12427 / ZAS-2) TaxID=545694 RepID=F5YN10_TREPZ|nr:tRNA 2-thiouridine(34) synthase MnmA [Treponema primitia]AEF83694.1 tRNA (5-methylaminomethyl-2-thiouridylate)-methyltransferase [Treponema primitia ZAS-2]
MKDKAVIAMSGGVDSSVAAWLMLERGYQCIGITLKLFTNDDIEPSANGRATHKGCCSLDDVNDARAVADRLGMPHYVLNFAGEFRDKVIRRFIETYEQGATPNPCIDCNRFIKFSRLLERARQLEFDTIVTGHYARIEQDGPEGRFLLKKALDAKKDQSYVLYAMTQDQLANTQFPLGELTKPQVRDIAEARGFVNARKHDSQDICFVPDRDYGSFIEQYSGKTFDQGNIIDEEGRILGRHKGLVRYTIGQRRGLGVAMNEPVYVKAKSVADNTVTLGPEESLYTKSLTASDLNLIAYSRLERPLRLSVKTRYLQAEQPAIAEQIGEDTLSIEFDAPQRAITPGQAVVLYDGDVVVGGGTIKAAEF